MYIGQIYVGKILREMVQISENFQFRYFGIAPIIWSTLYCLIIYNPKLLFSIIGFLLLFLT